MIHYTDPDFLLIALKSCYNLVFLSFNTNRLFYNIITMNKISATFLLVKQVNGFIYIASSGIEPITFVCTVRRCKHGLVHFKSLA